MNPGSRRRRRVREGLSRAAALVPAILSALILAGCAAPEAPRRADGAALVLVPISQAGIRDGRGRFREIFCAVLEARPEADATSVSCEQALRRLPDEPPGTGEPVDLSSSAQVIPVPYVLGLWSDCSDQNERAAAEFGDYLARSGFRLEMIGVSGISGSGRNAEAIRAALEERPATASGDRAVILTHSKGAVDVLEALVSYPDLHEKVAAVVSLAGAIGGSPLADTAPDALLEIAARTPGLKCREGDMQALESLRPAVRQGWLAQHRLPHAVRFYSIVAMPEPARVSSGLRLTYDKLADIDARNDGNLLYFDQVIPGGALLGYANADHWAIATDLADSEYALVRQLANRNDYPRKALIEAALRFVEEDLGSSPLSAH